MEQLSKSELEMKELKTIETKEEKRTECESFKEEASELRKKGDEAWALYNLTLEGGKELIKIYGAEKFTNAISEAKSKKEKRAKTYKSELNEEANMYEIIKILEPDKEKRSKLYKEMRKINEDLLENPDNRNVVFGDSRNNLELRKARINHFESLDGLSNLTLENIKRWLVPHWEIGNKGDYVGMTCFTDINVRDLEKQLKEYDDDVVRLVMDKYHSNNEKRRELSIKRDELIEKLNKEITEIIKETRIVFFKEHTDLIREREAVQVSTPIVEGGQEIIDAAVASMEETLKEHYKNAEKEIFEKTKEQRELINEIEKTRFSSSNAR